MCTVTYLPLINNDFVLTSSRDVPFSREKALAPKKYLEDGIALLYPKDGKAGGTWIGASNKKRLICLLNGGFENHKQKDFYAKSRGVIVKDLLKTNEISKACNAIDLKNIEPFTLVIVDWNFELKLIEFIWDGVHKHFKDLPQKAHIWSSSTLYSNKMKAMRMEWFSDWQKQNLIDKKAILEFHHNAGVGNPKVDVIMKRPKVGTVSITQVSKNEEEVIMNYEEISH